MVDYLDYLEWKGGGETMANRGKGWFGDSRGHAKAGRKGGLARGRRSKENNEQLYR